MKGDPPPRTDTREKIIDAAASLIPEVGWGGVTSRRVAKRAGVNPGVIHYHVGSVDELRRIAAVREIRAFFLERTSTALTLANPAAAIEALFRGLCAGDPRDPDLQLLYESLVAASRDQQLRVELAASLAELRQWLLDWFTAQGVTNPLPAAMTVTAAIDGFLLQRMLDPDLDPVPLIEGLIVVAAQSGEPTRGTEKSAEMTSEVLRVDPREPGTV